MPPELMGYEGRAIVIDPDVFAVGDIFELLSRDMEGKAIMCRRAAAKRPKEPVPASVMLLDCAKLRHWRTAEQFDELFEFKRDYMDWISLKLEPRGDDRPVRAGVERLRPPERADQAAAQHQAQDPALEDRAAGRLHARGQDPGASRRSAGVRRTREALVGHYALLGAYKPHRTRTRSACSSACCANASSRA